MSHNVLDCLHNFPVLYVEDDIINIVTQNALQKKRKLIFNYID